MNVYSMCCCCLLLLGLRTVWGLKTVWGSESASKDITQTLQQKFENNNKLHSHKDSLKWQTHWRGISIFSKLVFKYCLEHAGGQPTLVRASPTTWGIQKKKIKLNLLQRTVHKKHLEKLYCKFQTSLSKFSTLKPSLNKGKGSSTTTLF